MLVDCSEVVVALVWLSSSVSPAGVPVNSGDPARHEYPCQLRHIVTEYFVLHAHSAYNTYKGSRDTSGNLLREALTNIGPKTWAQELARYSGPGLS